MCRLACVTWCVSISLHWSRSSRRKLNTNHENRSHVFWQPYRSTFLHDTFKHGYYVRRWINLNMSSKPAINKKRMLLALVAVVGLGGVVLSVATVIMMICPGPKTRNEKAFLTALLQGDEQTAVAYLSPQLMREVEQQCPDKMVTRCIDDLPVSGWGEPEEIHFVVGSGSRNTTLYHMFWSNRRGPISVVLISTGDDNNPLILGWRGFILSEDEEQDGFLLRGTRTDNAFP